MVSLRRRPWRRARSRSFWRFGTWRSTVTRVWFHGRERMQPGPRRRALGVDLPPDPSRRRGASDDGPVDQQDECSTTMNTASFASVHTGHAPLRIFRLSKRSGAIDCRRHDASFHSTIAVRNNFPLELDLALRRTRSPFAASNSRCTKPTRLRAGPRTRSAPLHDILQQDPPQPCPK